MDTKQSPTNLGLSLFLGGGGGKVNCLEVFSTHFNLNNSLLKLLQISLIFRWNRALSPGQTDRQVVASGRKFNLRRDLRWVAKRTRKFYRKYTQVA